MKKIYSFCLSIIILCTTCFSLGTLNVSAYENIKDYGNAFVTVLDFDNWDKEASYKNATIFNGIDGNNRFMASSANIVNISSLESDKSNLEYALQLVDNGAIMVVQNESNIVSCEDLAKQMNIPVQDVTGEINNESIAILGYVVRRNSLDYKIEPIFATVMKPSVSSETFDIQTEIANLKESGQAYIDPIDIYCRIEDSDCKKENNISNKEILSGKLQMRTNFYTDLFGYGYLYGKNGNAVWGQQSGYTQFGYIEMYTCVIREKVLNGYRYDAVETLFTATGLNNKFIESYKVCNQVKGSGPSMVKYLYLNTQNTRTYTMSYTVTSQGIETSSSVSTEVNPGAQVTSTTKTNNKVVWNCNPNSNLNNSSWMLEGSCLTKTPSSSNAAMYISFAELVVDNWALEYTSPCPIVMTINY